MSEKEKSFEEEKTLEEILLDYKEQGCVFHGSPSSEINELKPNDATDVDKSNTFNNDSAVFAALETVSPIIFACMSKKNIPKEIQKGSWSVGPEKDGRIYAKIPKEWKPYIENNTGYLYVLNGDTFSEREGW